MNVEDLATARILVVDDKPEEAVPILTVLGEIGVGCVYVKGDKEEELPRDPVEGIRLVFLDLHLDEEGDQKSVLSKTVGVLKRCVAEKTMPLVVVCWTKHEKDVEAFREMAVTEISGLKPGFIVGMPKPAKGRPETWKIPLKEIRKTLERYDAIGLVWQWEKVLHDAATETSQALAGVSALLVASEKSEINDWQEGMLAVCRDLVRAEVGKTGSKKTVSNALFRMMNEMAIDRIHNSALKKPVSCAQKLVPEDKPTLDTEHISILNQMILVEPVQKGEKIIKPGNVYMPQGSSAKKCLFRKLGVDRVELYSNIDKGSPSKTHTPLLIEVSPSCDFAQNKRPICAFIAGYLLPAERKMRREDLYSLGPLNIPGQNGAKRIYLSKRFVYASGLRQDDISNRPICRLRSNVLIDLQVKLAAYKSRPGIAALE